MQRHGVRSEWASIPPAVRAHIDDVAGSRVVAATNLQGGFSPGPAARCELADGRLVFVKAAGTELNPDSPGMHRNEAAVLRALPPGHPSPRLIGVVDDGDWVALVVEWVEGRMPAAPLSDDETARLLRLVDRLADAGRGLSPVGILPFAERHPDLTGHWEHLSADTDGSAHALDPWSRQHAEQLTALDRLAPAATEGDTLVQLDLRTDNVLFHHADEQSDVVVDWPGACLAAPWVDLVTLLPALHLDGGPPPHEVFDRQPLARHAEPEAVDAFLAGFSGFFTRLALRPAPPGLPTLRPFQAAQGRIAREWLAHRLGIAPTS